MSRPAYFGNHAAEYEPDDAESAPLNQRPLVNTAQLRREYFNTAHLLQAFAKALVQGLNVPADASRTVEWIAHEFVTSTVADPDHNAVYTAVWTWVDGGRHAVLRNRQSAARLGIRPREQVIAALAGVVQDAMPDFASRIHRSAVVVL